MYLYRYINPQQLLYLEAGGTKIYGKNRKDSLKREKSSPIIKCKDSFVFLTLDCTSICEAWLMNPKLFLNG